MRGLTELGNHIQVSACFMDAHRQGRQAGRLGGCAQHRRLGAAKDGRPLGLRAQRQQHVVDAASEAVAL